MGQPDARTAGHPRRHWNSNLKLVEGADALRFSLELPANETQLGRDTAYELDKGFLLGASVELGMVTARYRGAHRLITKSTAIRFALVDKPAYPDSLLKLNRWQDWEGYVRDEESEPEEERAAVHRFLVV